MTRLDELQVIKSAGYATLPFSVCWSQDNFLCFITDKGVHVVEVMMSGVSEAGRIAVRQWIVKPSTYRPSQDCLINVAKLGQMLKPDELTRLMLDKTMSPLATFSAHNSYSIAAAWSPLSQKLSDTCLLAVLTSNGSLDIYSYGDENWVHILCVNENWSSYCVKQWNNLALKSKTPLEIVDELKQRSYQVKFTSFTWVNNPDGCLLLATGNQLGEIIIWKLKPGDSSANRDITIRQSVLLSCVFIYKTDLDSIGCLHCLPTDNGMLMAMVSCPSGKVQCLNINILSTEEAEAHPNNQVLAKSMLWSDMDQIQVPLNGTVGVLLSQGPVYIVPKLGHLLIFWLDKEANLINFTTFSTQDVSVSGIVWLSGSDFLITTHSGHSLILKVLTQLETNLVDVQVSGCELANRNNTLSYNGITASTNRAIFAAVNCLTAYHDTAVIKEPTTLVLYRIKTIDHFDCILNKENITSFHSVWDHMELVRIDLCNSKFSDEKCLKPKLETDDALNSMPIVEIKTKFWIYLITLNNYSTQNPMYHPIKQLYDELKMVIITYYQLRRVEALLSKADLSDEDKESLVISSKWFDYYVSCGRLNSYKKRCHDVLTSGLKNFMSSEVERCPLCNAACEALSQDLEMLCSTGHKLGRSLTTLLPVLGPPYFSCTYCREISTVDRADDDKVCILCDSPLKQDYQLIRDDKL